MTRRRQIVEKSYSWRTLLLVPLPLGYVPDPFYEIREFCCFGWIVGKSSEFRHHVVYASRDVCLEPLLLLRFFKQKVAHVSYCTTEISVYLSYNLETIDPPVKICVWTLMMKKLVTFIYVTLQNVRKHKRKQVRCKIMTSSENVMFSFVCIFWSHNLSRKSMKLK